jgi:hypothetical protein
MGRSLKAALAGACVGVGLLAGAPAASAQECTDLGGQGQLCTTGDPATGSFGVRLSTNQGLNLCVVVFARCP